MAQERRSDRRTLINTQSIHACNSRHTGDGGEPPAQEALQSHNTGRDRKRSKFKLMAGSGRLTACWPEHTNLKTCSYSQRKVEQRPLTSPSKAPRPRVGFRIRDLRDKLSFAKRTSCSMAGKAAAEKRIWELVSP